MKKILPLSLILFLILASCSGGKKVKLSEKNFEEEVQIQSALNFTFSQAMIPDSLVGIWTELEYIRFEPEIKGRFYWPSANKLVFAPTEDYKPATTYKARFTNEVFAHNKKQKFSGEREFEFHTPALQVLGSRAYWEIDETRGEPGIKLEMEFNYPVSPAEVSDLLAVKIGDIEVEPLLLSDETTEKVIWLVEDFKKEDKDYPVHFELDKGLVPQGGTDKTSEVFVEQFDIPSPFKLEIVDVESSHDGANGTITLYTSQEAVAEDIKKYIRISPSVRYSVEVEPGYILVKSEYFSIEQHYEVKVSEGLMGKIGGKLKYDFTQPVSFGKVKPTIKFYDEKEIYLSGKGSRNIQVAILNIPRVEIQVYKIYENNIQAYQNQGRYRDYYYDYETEDYYYYDSPDVGNMGDLVYTEEVETSSLPRKGSNRVLTLDFEDKLADNKGVYILAVKSSEDYWLSDTKMLVISDIGLIVKKGSDQIMVFANSLKTAQPLANVELTFIGQNNQVAHTAKTDANGVAVYEIGELKAEGFATALITAQLDDDYNMIQLRRTRINTSRFNVGGRHQNPANLDAFIYGDRNLYRPGEKVNLSAIVRDSEWKIPENIPVILEFVAPNGKVFKTVRKSLNEHGSFETGIQLPASAQTGSYVANVYTSTRILIGSQVIKVEEFMPDRIRVELRVEKTEYKPGEEVIVEAEAVNFFGPPAANRNYEVQFSTKRKSFYPKEYSDYNFYLTGVNNYFSNINRSGETNSEGRAREVFRIPTEYRHMGMLKSDIFVTVFDETGRPVNRLKQVSVYTQDIFYGIRCEDYYVQTNRPVKMDLIAVDKEGKAQKNVEAKLELIKHEYKTVLSKSGSYFRYRSEKVEKIIESKTITINETATHFGFIPEQSGKYELRISAPGARTYVSRNLYAYGWGSTSYSSFKVNNEGQIDIVPDKEVYEVGDKANLILKAPFTGKILVTLETDKVIDYFYVETDKRAASITLDLKEEYLPNIFVSATLFRPHDVSDIPLTVAHGYASLKIEKSDYKMPVEIKAAEKSRSNTRQQIKVKAKPNSAVTIAVVDEGILQVAGMATPDPYAFYYQPRALGVSTSNIYPYLFPELGMVRSHTGGGEGGEMAKRLNPMQNKRVKLVSYWSGIVETNARGEAEYTIDIPQFSGNLRIMAVAYEGQVFGSAQKNMKVADPIVLSVGLPRFLSPGDLVKMPVIITNTTEKDAKCKTTVSVEGVVKTQGEKSMTVSIPANREAELPFVIAADKAIGESKITVKTEALGETFEHVTDITVRPASPLQKRVKAGTLEAGKKANIPVEVDDFIESSLQGKLLISKNPMVQFTNSLDYLVRYPYGCVEQTVSSAFPQIYFADLVGTVYSQDRTKNDAVSNVQHALDRIKLMQLYNGGLTYWPGTGRETWWGSVYAAHFTLEAQKAGYEIDESFMKALLKYLKKKLREKELITYYYNGNRTRKIAPRSAIYSLYVLSMAGEKPMALLNYYSTRTENLSLDSRYMLAAAYGLCGNMDKARRILPDAFTGEKANTSFGGSFYSALRDEALALNVLLEIDPENPQIGLMTKHVSSALKNRRYMNTQERTFSMLAMGKMAKAAAESDISGQVLADNKKLGSFDNSDLYLSMDKLGKKDIEIVTEGKGKLYYYWEAEGISADGTFIEEDSYLKVRKTFYDRNGSEITNNRFKQNDLVLVRLSIVGLNSRRVENVAISDILPACFEIENPRLTTLPPGMRFPTTRSRPDYMDIRDDRINMFMDVSTTTRYYYYLVRVVTKGTFIMGPVGADAMYDGEYHSYSGAGIIVVE